MGSHVQCVGVVVVVVVDVVVDVLCCVVGVLVLGSPSGRASVGCALVVNEVGIVLLVFFFSLLMLCYCGCQCRYGCGVVDTYRPEVDVGERWCV